MEDVTLGMERLPELIRLLAQAEGPMKVRGRVIVPAVVMDLDDTLREGSLTPEVARALACRTSGAVRGVSEGAARGRRATRPAEAGGAEHWFTLPLQRALTRLAVAAGPALFTGLTEPEVEAATRAVLVHTRGGKIFEGVRETVRAADQAEVPTFIVTAGLEAPARVVAEVLGIPRERVHGTRPLKTRDGTILPFPKGTLPFGAGKSDAVTSLFSANGLDPRADPFLVLGDNPLVTDSGLVRRGYVKAIVEPDARGRAYIEEALARGELVFAIDVRRRRDGRPVEKFVPRRGAR